MLALKLVFFCAFTVGPVLMLSIENLCASCLHNLFGRYSNLADYFVERDLSKTNCKLGNRLLNGTKFEFVEDFMNGRADEM